MESKFQCIESTYLGILSTNMSEKTRYLMAQIIWSWQCCRLLVGNIANGIAFKKFLLKIALFSEKCKKKFGGNAIGNVANQK